jgi:uncharacterized LabA/DUF88 family protein
MKTVGLFVDVSNIYFCVNKAFPGHKVDYAKYRDLAVDNGIIFRAVACGMQSNPESAKFVACLNHLGYETRFKQYEKRYKFVNTNIIITMEILKSLSKLDRIVLGTADPNFVELINHCKSEGIEVHVLACGINHYLKETANSFQEITEDLLENAAPDPTQ